MVRIGTVLMIAGAVNLGMVANRPGDRPPAAVASSPVAAPATLAAVDAPGPSAVDPVVAATDPPVPPADRATETLSYGPDPEHLLDVHWPFDTTDAPAIMYLHSGGWATGTRANIPDFILGQLDNGWVIISVDYRLAPRHPFPAASHDVDRAMRWAKLHARSLGIDPGRIVLAGGSAGGHLATTAAAAPGRLRDPNLPEDLAIIDPRPVALLALVAPTDLTTLVHTTGIGGPLTADFLACATPATCSPIALAEASPVNHIAGAPPALFLYGELDTLVPTDPHGTAIAAAWRAGNADVTVLTIAGAGHNLDLSTVDPATISSFLERWFPGATPRRAAPPVGGG